jgi:hypothetical protein
MIFKLELNNLYSNKITCVCVDLEVNDNVWANNWESK